MGLKGGFVPVDFIEPDPVFVAGVLDYVKAQAARLIVHRAFGVLDDGLDKLFFVAFPDLDRGDDYVHRASSWPGLDGCMVHYAGIIINRGLRA